MKFKNAAMFALAFKKLQAKGNRITPRDRQYIFDEYSSPLKDSTESLQDENKKNVRIQTEAVDEMSLSKKVKGSSN
ncbi:unnamed protein product [Allacma fusca]|uniref:Uncharacterized protein n=1 Tax=Allacma fusca TaxID=39272 RepID=A0A8J2KGL7_9HEXA|nr:unnamed protein product [Allacma fusca]